MVLLLSVGTPCLVYSQISAIPPGYKIGPSPEVYDSLTGLTVVKTVAVLVKKTRADSIAEGTYKKPIRKAGRLGNLTVYRVIENLGGKTVSYAVVRKEDVERYGCNISEVFSNTGEYKLKIAGRRYNLLRSLGENYKIIPDTTASWASLGEGAILYEETEVPRLLDCLDRSETGFTTAYFQQILTENEFYKKRIAELIKIKSKNSDYTILPWNVEMDDRFPGKGFSKIAPASPKKDTAKIDSVRYSFEENEKIQRAVLEWKEYKKADLKNGMSVLLYAKENEDLKKESEAAKKEAKIYEAAYSVAKKGLFFRWKRFVKTLEALRK